MRSEVIRARNAVAVVFALSGVAMATWLSRIPHVRDQLGLTPGELGRMLLLGALGAIVALPTAGLVVNRIGGRRAVAGGALLMALGAALVGLGTGPAASVAVVSAGLFTIGYGVGTVDVAMNVEGAAVERRLGRAIMPRLHAAFSLGTVVGAGFGAIAAATGLPVPVHLGALAIVTVAVALPACRWFLPPAEVPAGRDGSRPAGTGLWAVWREPRTLLVGVMVLGSAFSEGTANEWLAVGLVDGFEVSNAVGAIGYAVFVTAMTVGRIWGTPAIDRFGRVPVLRTSAGLTVAGVLLVVFGGSMPVALAGAVVWGAGAALGFPVGMSAAADDPVRAAVRVSVVSSIGYAAFLAGPPLLGWLGDHLGVQRALLVVVVAAAVSALVAGATREPPGPAGRPAPDPAPGQAPDRIAVSAC
jgi:fucose permease